MKILERRNHLSAAEVEPGCGGGGGWIEDDVAVSVMTRGNDSRDSLSPEVRVLQPRRSPDFSSNVIAVAHAARLLDDRSEQNVSAVRVRPLLARLELERSCED